jgi:Ca-activated chloride channel family protein
MLSSVFSLLAIDQTKEPAQPVIRVRSNLVQVPVSVTDTSGQPVRNLTADDFGLEEDGRPQAVRLLGEPGKTPVELALLFDVSGSVHKRFQFEQEVAARFLKEVLKPGDAVSIFSIGLTPRLVQARTTDSERAITGIKNMASTKEATAFFDSVVEAVHYLRKNAGPGARRVQVVISDGEDNQSDRYQLNGALRELQRADCIFYAINPSGPSIRLNKISLKGHAGMETLATQTGGAAFLLDKIEDMESVFRQIATELQAQYLLGYYADDPSDGGFRRIVVRVPKRADLRIRARQGYFGAEAISQKPETRGKRQETRE